MDTYGDLVTLLLTFFVLLYAFSSTDEVKWARLVEIVTGTPQQIVTAPIDPTEPIPGLTPEDMAPELYNVLGKSRMENLDPERTEQSDPEDVMGAEERRVEAEMSELYEKLQGYVEENDLQGVITIKEPQDDMIHIVVLSGVLFDSGRADIKPEGGPRLQEVGDMIHQSLEAVQLIYVRGHTDTNPISTSRFPDNFELSTARANAAARYISTNCDIPLSMFNSWGRGEWDPIAPNDTPENMAKNRRVEIIVASKNAEGGLFGEK